MITLILARHKNKNSAIAKSPRTRKSNSNSPKNFNTIRKSNNQYFNTKKLNNVNTNTFNSKDSYLSNKLEILLKNTRKVGPKKTQQLLKSFNNFQKYNNQNKNKLGIVTKNGFDNQSQNSEKSQEQINQEILIIDQLHATLKRLLPTLKSQNAKLNPEIRSWLDQLQSATNQSEKIKGIFAKTISRPNSNSVGSSSSSLATSSQNSGNALFKNQKSTNTMSGFSKNENPRVTYDNEHVLGNMNNPCGKANMRLRPGMTPELTCQRKADLKFGAKGRF